MKLSIEMLIEDVIKLKEKIGKIPSRYEYSCLGSYGTSTVRRHFGTWNNFLLKAFGETHPKKKAKIITKKCLNPNCNNFFDIKDWEKKDYCCKKCSNQCKNRKKKKTFCECGNEITSRKKYCSKCLENKSIENKTLGEFTSLGSARYSQIREHARKVAKVIEDKCLICGYDKHVEIAHIKAISKFESNSLVKEINDLNNLVKLCPNHHWELDRGLLKI